MQLFSASPFVLCCVLSRHVIDLNYDGRNSPISFSADDDLEAIARHWTRMHPAAIGAGCTDARCVELTLVDAMRKRLEDRVGSFQEEMLYHREVYESVLSRYSIALDAVTSAMHSHNNTPPNALGVIRDAMQVCGGVWNSSDGSTSKAAATLAAIETLALREKASLAFALEQVSGFCFCVAEDRATQLAERSPDIVRPKQLFHRRFAGEQLDPALILTQDLSKTLQLATSASHIMAAYAAFASVSLDNSRAHALKFGSMSALEVSDPRSAAWFALSLARLKRPAHGSSRVVTSRHESQSLPWTIDAPGLVEIDEDLEFGHGQFGGLHDTAVEFAADQLRWIAEREVPCETNVDLNQAAEGLDILAAEARQWRAEGNAGSHHVPFSLLAQRVSSAEGSAEAVDAAMHVFGRLTCITPNPDPPLPRTVRIMHNSEVDRIVEQFASTGVAVVDDFFTVSALTALREFVLGSTIFTRVYIQGYIGAFLADGFGASAVVQQVADELRTLVFPDLLAGAQLRQAWAYVYARHGDDGSSHPKGIDAHADDADVSINVWITPDEANLKRRPGGLVIYQPTQPKNWTFAKANHDSGAIYDYLENNAEEDASITVPYRFNRATLLNGYRFHKTDTLDFKPGFGNHRINLTFLFKMRSGPSSASC